jgi:hypothetical protein
MAGRLTETVVTGRYATNTPTQAMTSVAARRSRGSFAVVVTFTELSLPLRRTAPRSLDTALTFGAACGPGPATAGENQEIRHSGPGFPGFP